MAVAPQNIMAQLRGMPDAQLAKYAAMHKNDPFIFPLAFQESQTRKQTRASQQAQMAGQQQPKVVDQDLQQMMPAMPQPAPVQQTAQLPEDTGIGQLPAQNLQRMADGGIVAFEEGGEVPRFQNQGLVYAPYGVPAQATEEEIAEYNRKKQLGFLGNLREMMPSFDDTPMAQRNAEAMLAQRQIDKYKNAPNQTSAEAARLMAANATPAPALEDKPNANRNLTMADKGKKDTGADKKKPGGIPALVPAALGASAPAQADAGAAPSGLSGIAAYAKEGNEYTGPSPIKGQQERLDKQESKAAEDKKDALNMALMKAGLGMMAGRSQYALQNIAEGGKGGLEDYAASMKDLKRAALERDKMRNELENADYAYKRDDVKGYKTHMEKADDRAIEMKKAQLSADTNLQVANIHKSATLGAAGMPSAQERLVNRIGTDPKFAESYKNYVSMQPEARAGLVTRDSALKNWSGNIMLQSQYPNFEDYYKMAASGTPTASAGANTSGWGNMTVR